MATSALSSGNVPVPHIMPALTGLRGLTALWVLVFHVAQFSDAFGPTPLPGPRALLDNGWVGVDIFFLLSGFVLLHAHADDFAASPWRSAPRFLRARFWRVYPLSAAVLAVIGAIVLCDPHFAAAIRNEHAANLSFGALLRTLTLSTRWFGEAGDWNQPVWSLSVEVIGYTAFPLIAFLILRISQALHARMAAFASLVLWLAIQSELDALGTNLIHGAPSVWRMACGFVAGVALYRARMLATPAEARHAPVVGIASVAVAAMLLSLNGIAFVPFCAAGLVWAMTFATTGLIQRALQSGVAMFLGRISFPLYLLHVMALRWLFSVVQRWAIFSPAAYVVILASGLAAIVAGAWLLHLWIERPCARLAHRVGRSTGTETAALPGRTAVA